MKVEGAEVPSRSVQRRPPAPRMVLLALPAVVGAAAAWPAIGAAQRVPESRVEVAQPGGRLPGAQPLAPVQAVRGFRDPSGVAAAKDGSGRLFVAERAGRVRLVLAGGGGGGAPLAVTDGLREFREHLGGELTVALLAAIGRGVEVQAMDEGLIAEAVGWLRERDGGP